MGILGIDVEIETSDLPPDFKYKESTKSIEDLAEDDKGQWIELGDDELKNQMSGLMGYLYDKEIGNVDWGALNFTTYVAEYYKEKSLVSMKMFIKYYQVLLKMRIK